MLQGPFIRLDYGVGEKFEIAGSGLAGSGWVRLDPVDPAGSGWIRLDPAGSGGPGWIRLDPVVLRKKHSFGILKFLVFLIRLFALVFLTSHFLVASSGFSFIMKRTMNWCCWSLFRCFIVLLLA